MTMTTRGCHPCSILCTDKPNSLYFTQKGGDHDGVHVFNGEFYNPIDVLRNHHVQQSGSDWCNRRWSFIRYRVGSIGGSPGFVILTRDLIAVKYYATKMLNKCRLQYGGSLLLGGIHA